MIYHFANWLSNLTQLSRIVIIVSFLNLPFAIYLYTLHYGGSLSIREFYLVSLYYRTTLLVSFLSITNFAITQLISESKLD